MPPDIVALQADDASLSGSLQQLRRVSGKPTGAALQLSLEYNGTRRAVEPVGLQRIVGSSARSLAIATRKASSDGRHVMIWCDFLLRALTEVGLHSPLTFSRAS